MDLLRGLATTSDMMIAEDLGVRNVEMNFAAWRDTRRAAGKADRTTAEAE